MIDFWHEKKFEQFFVRQGFPLFSESLILSSFDDIEINGRRWDHGQHGIIALLSQLSGK